jgi:hypothetical protein
MLSLKSSAKASKIQVSALLDRVFFFGLSLCIIQEPLPIHIGRGGVLSVLRGQWAGLKASELGNNAFVGDEYPLGTHPR